ncbi:hypothetical protein B9Z55_012160 [Caenorhabditis nigoni]|uniref:SCP domain-containing protein n=1 Tax=Caenorhabditis nigoni TaxID=1611254 RepID=A0A2G5TWY4_9PELO|nr:hypothetical protein B9Z55_012160 [Caenorhabditis nigoni]
MKFLPILILLLISYSSESEVSIFQHGATEMETEPIVHSMNWLRKKIAEERNIANMNELKWDHHLEQIAESLKCGDMENGPDYMVSIAPNEKLINQIFKIPLKKQDKAILKVLGGLAAPGQTGFACAEFFEKCSRKDGVEIDGICLSGPK